MSNLTKCERDAACVKADGAVTSPSKTTTAAQIMAVCRAVTPQFYKGQSVDDLKAEKAAIELLTAHIDDNVLAKMCELSVQSYATARSDNGKVYFDINYFLSFYRTAFNYVWCDSVNVPSDAELKSSHYDPISRMSVERYVIANGDERVVKYISDERETVCHSPKYFSRLVYTIGDNEEL